MIVPVREMFTSLQTIFLAECDLFSMSKIACYLDLLVVKKGKVELVVCRA